ncbi:MAG: bifunctional diaminohydroxyphosphoribosylaminopyrimidine deaminase/5-amino-6-(5-phosphoribosylamino)uracil reductase RibD [Ignavibacteria bacterium]|nr:bifunctional diaminohydroxyphosphoribosylaminopyrimidine deaminase/5-amino-6-(5-phosphoribosylamino)uracil reductase RibD [Ignavibacteria bacterium]
MTTDEKIMQGCIALAKKGAGYVSPNPLVGCIIINNGEIIGEGYHEKYGEPHAEANAIEDAKKKGHSLVGAKLYVNLEPCSHFGKRPPCADLIVKEKIGEVYIGMQDPYEEVNGKGIEKLEQAGIKVTAGILEKECRELNKFFITYVTEERPYVTLKIAQSIDGAIALNNGKSKYITNKTSREFVHRMRSEYDAVLIGKNTAKMDNPDLNVREVEGRNPLRIVIDKNLKLPKDLKIFCDNDKDKTYVITNDKEGENLIRIKNKISSKKILKKLYEMKINSIIVEGGAHLFSQFLKDELFDDVYFFIAPKIIGNGLSPFNNFKIKSLDKVKNLKFEYQKNLDNDILLYYKNLCSQE